VRVSGIGQAFIGRAEGIGGICEFAQGVKLTNG